MPANPLDRGVLKESRAAVARHNGSITAAARSINIPESTLRSRVKKATENGLTYDENVPALPDFGDDDIPIEQIIKGMSDRFRKKQAYTKAREWFDIPMQEDKPIGLCLMGDPHVDDNGCNWPLLIEDCEIMANTPGMYCVQMGDASNA